jgi:hypothetical protein
LGLVCERIGKVTVDPQVFFVDDNGERSLFLDFLAEPLTGFSGFRETKSKSGM